MNPTVKAIAKRQADYWTAKVISSYKPLRSHTESTLACFALRFLSEALKLQNNRVDTRLAEISDEITSRPSGHLFTEEEQKIKIRMLLSGLQKDGE